jgi:hypothetical protein
MQIHRSLAEPDEKACWWRPLVADALDLTADLLYAQWKRAVDMLWRETVHRRQANLAERERARSVRRMKSLQRIVRKALADYHRIELERQDRLEGKSPA